MYTNLRMLFTKSYSFHLFQPGKKKQKTIARYDSYYVKNQVSMHNCLLNARLDIYPFTHCKITENLLLIHYLKSGGELQRLDNRNSVK